MPVLKVLSTKGISGSASEYQVVQTGYYRVLATAGASTVSFTDYSEFVDHEDNEIAILGKGTCVVTVGN